jgi:hypothetical protein
MPDVTIDPYFKPVVRGTGGIVTSNPAPGVIEINGAGSGPGGASLSGPVSFGAGAPTPAALPAGNTNDWTPVGFATAVRLEVTAAGSATVTGLTGGTDGRYMIVTNVGANDVTLLAQDAGSVAVNRFASNGDTTLLAGYSAAFIYSGALARWSRIGF